MESKKSRRKRTVKQWIKRRVGKGAYGGRRLLVIVLVLFLVSLFAIKTFGAVPTVAENGEGSLLIRFSPFTEDCQEPQTPPDVYFWEGETYERVSSRIVTAQTEEITRRERKQITYSDVEQLDHLPEETVMTATNAETGVTVRAVLPACAVDRREGRWIDDFQFPITVENYEAGVYELSGELVTCGEEEPFSGYEGALLELIGADPEYYEIRSTFWTAEPEATGEGRMIRKAMAVGRRYVADCLVTYEGPVVFPAMPALCYEAEYRIPKEESVVVMEEAPEEVKEIHIRKQESKDFPFGRLITLTTVTVSLLLLVCLLIVLYLLRRKRKKG